MKPVVLVTGGAGYIGSHTIVQLLKQSYSVVCVDNYSNSSPDVLDRIREIVGPNLSSFLFQVTADLKDSDIDSIFTEHSISCVIHFAGLKAVGESVTDPLRYYENNIKSTLALLMTMKKHNVKRIIFSSSATVYGRDNTSPLSETMATTNPASPYGKTKLYIENILQDVCTSDPEFQAIILRYFNPIGAHSSGLIGESPKGIPNNLMPYLLEVALGKFPELKVFGSDYDTLDGTAERDYIHVMDLADGHIAAMQFRETGAHIFNLGLGNPVSVLQLVQCLSKISSKDIPYKLVGRRPGDATTVYSDPSKSRKYLNWEAKCGLTEMCLDCWNWALKKKI